MDMGRRDMEIQTSFLEVNGTFTIESSTDDETYEDMTNKQLANDEHNPIDLTEQEFQYDLDGESNYINPNFSMPKQQQNRDMEIQTSFLEVNETFTIESSTDDESYEDMTNKQLPNDEHNPIDLSEQEFQYDLDEESNYINSSFSMPKQKQNRDMSIQTSFLPLNRTYTYDDEDYSNISDNEQMTHEENKITLSEQNMKKIILVEYKIQNDGAKKELLDEFQAENDDDSVEILNFVSAENEIIDFAVDEIEKKIICGGSPGDEKLTDIHGSLLVRPSLSCIKESSENKGHQSKKPFLKKRRKRKKITMHQRNVGKGIYKLHQRATGKRKIRLPCSQQNECYTKSKSKESFIKKHNDWKNKEGIASRLRSSKPRPSESAPMLSKQPVKKRTKSLTPILKNKIMNISLTAPKERSHSLIRGQSLKVITRKHEKTNEFDSKV